MDIFIREDAPAKIESSDISFLLALFFVCYTYLKKVENLQNIKTETKTRTF